MNNPPKILIFVDWFEPGFKAGGPIRSCVNFAHHMKDRYDLFVFTSDRDLGDEQAYPEIIPDQWIHTEAGLQLFYASPAFLDWRKIRQQINTISPDYIYINSMFSVFFSIYPLLMKRFGQIRCKMILAPRGMLKSSALSFKPVKKKIFLLLLHRLRINRFITFHATDDTELNDIATRFGVQSSISHIANFPGSQSPFQPPPSKEAGELKMIFVGRIHPVKNLLFLLKALVEVSDRVMLTVVAAMEDEQYWLLCKEWIKKLPSNVCVTLSHDIPHREIEGMIKAHHIFVLPTQGENFGHAIFEAMAAGRPVLISDQTPWRNLEASKAGWDLSLDSPAKFSETIHKAALSHYEEWLDWCKHTWQYCNKIMDNSDIKNKYVKLFS
ncbi:MAG: glycosyltransferase [Chitinophagaceae bacterium]